MRIIVIAMLLAASITGAKAGTWMQYLFDCTGHTCVIKNSDGGTQGFFELAAKEVRRERIKVVLDGPCASYCAAFAAWVRDHTCITKRARIEIHYGREQYVYAPGPLGKEVDVFSPDALAIYQKPPPFYRVEHTYFLMDYGVLTEWALREHKMPYSTDTYTLTRSEMLRFWKPCGHK